MGVVVVLGTFTYIRVCVCVCMGWRCWWCRAFFNVHLCVCVCVCVCASVQGESGVSSCSLYQGKWICLPFSGGEPPLPRQCLRPTKDTLVCVWLRVCLFAYVW